MNAGSEGKENIKVGIGGMEFIDLWEWRTNQEILII